MKSIFFTVLINKAEFIKANLYHKPDIYRHKTPENIHL